MKEIKYIKMPPVEGESFKEKCKRKWHNALAWCKENEDVLIVVVPVVASLAALGIKKGSKMYKQHLEHLDKDLTIYDNRLGHYWRLKRKLSNKEYLEIDARKRAGEALSDILVDLNVLK